MADSPALCLHTGVPRSILSIDFAACNGYNHKLELHSFLWLHGAQVGCGAEQENGVRSPTRNGAVGTEKLHRRRKPVIGVT